MSESSENTPDLDPRTGLPKSHPSEPPPPAEAGTVPPPVNLPGESEEDIHEELKKWNWGAFFLTWIWGIGNNTLAALLALLPFVNFPMMFVLGLKGNAWAWKNKEWYSLAHFRDTQQKWAKWGAIIGLLVLVCFGGMFASIVFGVTGLLKHNEAYLASFQVVRENTEVQAVLGSPVKTGFFVGGNFQSSGANGEIHISYSVKGPQNSGKVYVEAYQENGIWSYEFVGIEMGKEKTRLDLTPTLQGGKAEPEAVEEMETSPDPGNLRKIQLKNGNEIQGEIVEEDAEMVSVETKELGLVVFNRDEIATIE